MSFYWVKTNALIKRCFPKYLWDYPNTCNKIYLTFDDGPTPEITPWVLDVLEKENIKATFFCIGKNIEANTELFQKIINQGHSVGNHTNHHLNGWKNSVEKYVQNTLACEEVIEKHMKKKPNLFRPPYGKIQQKQAKKLKDLGYKIVMWDVLSADFDTTISPEKCLKNATKDVESGSVIVFHDSVKASKNLYFALPKAINELKQKGFVFERL